METKIISYEEYEKVLRKTKELENKIVELEQHLKKYTAPNRSKKYYQEHKEEIIAQIKSNPPTTEKKREYNKRCYEKRKQCHNLCTHETKGDS
jgi:hypothetical protein